MYKLALAALAAAAAVDAKPVSVEDGIAEQGQPGRQLNFLFGRGYYGGYGGPYYGGPFYGGYGGYRGYGPGYGYGYYG